jgi:hypothetical protein
MADEIEAIIREKKEIVPRSVKKAEDESKEMAEV